MSINLKKDDLSYGQHVYLNMRIRVRDQSKEALKEVHARQRAVVIDAKSAKLNKDGSITIYFSDPVKENNVNTPEKFTVLSRIYYPVNPYEMPDYTVKSKKEFVIK